MNAADIINDKMTLEQKLEAIANAMNDKATQATINKRLGRAADAPIDPADLTMCEGCQ